MRRDKWALDMGTPRGEMLLAVIGLGPIVAEGNARLNEEKRAKLGRLPQTIEKACRDFLTETSWQKPKSPGPVEWKPWVALMTVPEPDRARKCIEVSKQLLDPEDAGAYAGQALEAWNYLAAQFPRTMKRQLIGVAPEPPPEAYLYRFRRAYFTCDDPIGLLEQLQCGFVNSDEVAAFEKIFPMLYAQVGESFVREAVKHKTAHPRWELPRKRWEPLRTFLNIPRKPGYVAELQARFAMPDIQEGRTPGTLPRDPGESSTTPTQRAELR